MADPSAPAQAGPDAMVAARAVIVGLEAVADLFASFAMQANRLAGVLEASVGPAGDTLVDWVAAARDQQAEREADEIERRLADDRTEPVRIAGADLRFPRP